MITWLLKHIIVLQTGSIEHVIIRTSSSDSVSRFECSLHKSNVTNGVSFKRNCASVVEIYIFGKINVRSY